jgi:hypothetical protein
MSGCRLLGGAGVGGSVVCLNQDVQRCGNDARYVLGAQVLVTQQLQHMTAP